MNDFTTEDCIHEFDIAHLDFIDQGRVVKCTVQGINIQRNVIDFGTTIGDFRGIQLGKNSF
ncbi:hypothetical protein D3C71_1233620 [compost metagenome]